MNYDDAQEKALRGVNDMWLRYPLSEFDAVVTYANNIYRNRIPKLGFDCRENIRELYININDTNKLDKLLKGLYQVVINNIELYDKWAGIAKEKGDHSFRAVYEHSVWLKKFVLDEFLTLHDHTFKKVTTAKQNKITLKQIALMYIYSGEQITRENGNEIAEKYGYTSGEKLFHYYSHYSSRTNRTGEEHTPKKTENKIKLFESVLKLLPKDKHERIKDEISILQSYLDKKSNWL